MGENLVNMRSFLAGVFLLTISQVALARGMYPGEKQYLCDSITRIYVWTYMVNDTMYRFDTRIMEEVTARLRQKGYPVMQVFYPSGQYPDPSAWVKALTKELAPHEALLVFPVKLISDSLVEKSGFGRNRQTIVDPSGSALHTRETTRFTDQTDTLVILSGEATLYLPRHKEPVYQKRHTLNRPDAMVLARYCLSGIPKSRHPAALKYIEKPINKGKATMEIAPLAGFMFGASRRVDQGSPESISYQSGTARFAPNFQYGISLSFSLTNSLDLALSFRREVTTDSLPMQFYINYLMIGAGYTFQLQQPVKPYIGFSLGAANLTPSNHYYRDVWYLALGVQAGARYYNNKWLGLRLQGDLFYQLNPAHAPFLYSMQTAGKGVDALSAMVQAGITAGVIFRF